MFAVNAGFRTALRPLATLAVAAACLAPSLGQAASAYDEPFKFKMVRSPGAVNAGCLEYAKGKVSIENGNEADTLTLQVKGLWPKSEYDFFITQVPNPPFGLSWYQGDIKTNEEGEGKAVYKGRFNEETFIIGLDAAVAPVVHEGDGSASPATGGPIHTFHLGLWFNDPADAIAAGCGELVTPFNGEHDAGPQILNTSNFEDLDGPLGQNIP